MLPDAFPAYLVGKDLEVKKGLFHRKSLVFEEKEVRGEVNKAIMPSFFNSHVHLMDSIVADPPVMPLEDLVGPGGYKFKIISSANEEELIRASREAIGYALSRGTSNLADFREMGWKGIKVLKAADEFGAVMALARPGDVAEAEEMCKEGYIKGFGMSSVRDHEYHFLEELRKLAKRYNVLFGIHAGERDDEDVEGAIALEPDFLVHMNRASIQKLKLVMDSGIPVITCFRSNFFFELENRKNYSILAEYERWGIGTDNVMIATPSILGEINFAAYLVNPESLFRAAFFGFELFKAREEWILVDISGLKYSRNLISSLSRRIYDERVECVLKGVKIE